MGDCRSCLFRAITTKAISAPLWVSMEHSPQGSPTHAQSAMHCGACKVHQQQSVAHSTLQASLQAEHQALHPLLACFHPTGLESSTTKLSFCTIKHCFLACHPMPAAVIKPSPYACSPVGAAAAAAEPALLEQPAVAGTPADDRLFVQRLKHMSYNGQYDELFARPIDAKKPVRGCESRAVLSTPPGSLRPGACPSL